MLQAGEFNSPDAVSARTEYGWETARAVLEGLPGGGLNMAHEAVDRHAHGAAGRRRALRVLSPGGPARDLSYAELAVLSSRFANVLQALGVRPGERVCSVLGPGREVFIALLGALKHGCVVCPLFTAFGPQPLETRLRRSEASVLVTTAALYRRKVAPLRARLPALRHVLLVGGADSPGMDPALDMEARLAGVSAEYAVAATGAQTPALLHFTSGTTGPPKGVLHVHEALVAQHATARTVLDLRPGDIYWCTAEPGWVTGSVYGILAPLSVGASLVVDTGGFDPARWYAILEQERVNVWYTAPTAVRMLMKQGAPAAHERRFPALRLLASVGEPLPADAVHWAREVFGRPLHDTWWQTETGAIMIANRAGADIRPGAMGRPVPGVEAAILQRDAAGSLRRAGPGDVGELALRTPWPSMFRAYLGDETRYRECFAEGWYLSGDLARCDAEGYFWFVARADDVINTAGHLVGPFEVESALLSHPAVADVAAIGMPDPLVLQAVTAVVELRPGHRADAALRKALLAHARNRLGPGVAPRQIEFIAALPRTRSGKILRRVLQARMQGMAVDERSDEGI